MSSRPPAPRTWRTLERLLTHEQAKDSLTPRELQVLRGILDVLTDKEIASRLGIETRTARWHVSNILSKFQVSDRVQLIVWFYRKLTSRNPRSGMY